MPSGALLISDDLERSKPVVKTLGKRLPVKSVALSDYSENSDHGALFVVVDLDLTNRKTIEQFKKKIRAIPSTKEKYFVTHEKILTERFQANALGAISTLPSHFDLSDVDRIMNHCAANAKNMSRQGIPEETAQVIEGIRSLNDDIYQAVSSGGPLPKAQIIHSCDQITESLTENSIGYWLEWVRQHNSYTFRHCMTVSGIAVAFAQHLGMGKADVQRIAIGALMHDVGKVRIPLSILDKPGKLSPQERTEINKHPGYSAEILRKDGQFEDEVVDIAHYHHELLDGTGYPDGLVSDQISDPVRIMTIVDIYSALIDKRSYKEAMPANEAYQILLDMDGKLDMDILKAFATVAQAAEFRN